MISWTVGQEKHKKRREKVGSILKNRKLKWIIKGTLLALTLLLPLATILTKYLYYIFEGKDISFSQSFLFVMQTFTTTGYGELLPFQSSVMNFYAIFLMIIGLSLIFMLLATASAEWLQSHFEEIPPHKVNGKLENHIILCHYNSLTESLIEELTHHHMPYVIIENNISVVRELMHKAIPVVLGDATEHDVLMGANIQTAAALIVSDKDEQNVKIVLEARTLTEKPILVSVRNSKYKNIFKIAGASEEIFPKYVLGQELARWALSILNATFISEISNIDGLIIKEFPVGLYCRFANQTLRESKIRETTGVTVLGLWRNGVFHVIDNANMILSEESIVVIMGTEQQLNKLAHTMTNRILKQNIKSDKVIIAGFGDVAKRTVEILKKHEKHITVIVKNRTDHQNFIQGDITSKELLMNAGLKEASTYIISVDEDDEAIFSVLAAKTINPNIRIIARTNSHHNVAKLYKAGADFVLSFSKVGGNMISSLLIEHHQKNIPDFDIHFFDHRINQSLNGKKIAQTKILTHTGCLIAAVKKPTKEIFPNPSPNMLLNENDVLILLGNRQNIERFKNMYEGNLDSDNLFMPSE